MGGDQIRNTYRSYEEQHRSGELASVLSGLPYRVVVMSRQGLARYTPTERDGFVVDGTAESIGVVLRTQMILTKGRVDALFKQLTRDMRVVPENKEQDLPALLIPAKRFLRNQFLFANFSTSVPLTEQTPERIRMTVARLTCVSPWRRCSSTTVLQRPQDSSEKSYLLVKRCPQ